MTVARYIAEFQAIASHLSWNAEALCLQFYEGLIDIIKDEIAKNLSTTLKEFITAVTRIDNRCLECPRIIRPEIKPPISIVESLRPPSAKVKKLDDEERSRCLVEGLCFMYREKSHTSADCPTRSDKQPGVYSVMLSADPFEKPVIFEGPLVGNFARKTGPCEADVRWRTGSTALVEQA